MIWSTAGIGDGSGSRRGGDDLSPAFVGEVLFGCARRFASAANVPFGYLAR